MKITKKLITLLMPIALLSACATDSYENKKETMVDISIGLRGNNYFCVYGKSWKLDGWRSPVVSETKEGMLGEERKVCTEQAPFKGRPDQYYFSNFYTHYGSGVIIGKREFKKLEVTFKRSVDGPIIKMEFNLVGKLNPELPWQYGAIYPVITETGIELMRRDYKFEKKLVDMKDREIFIEFKKDGEQK